MSVHRSWCYLSKREDEKRLYRSKKDSKIAGVCSGMGDYFEIDPVIVRLIFLATFFIGAGSLVYLIGWLIIPMGEEWKD